jgi:sarcosine oxidase subunit delta
MKKGWVISPTCIDGVLNMIINHPLLGPRDSAEFVYMGDATLIERPDPAAETALADFVEYAYMRNNPAGNLRELWFHEAGDRSWLVVTRNTITHEITDVQIARDVARQMGRSK